MAIDKPDQGIAFNETLLEIDRLAEACQIPKTLIDKLKDEPIVAKMYMVAQFMFHQDR